MSRRSNAETASIRRPKKKCNMLNEDETYEASPAITSESSESPATAAAMSMFA